MATIAEAAEHLFIDERTLEKHLDEGNVTRQPRGAYELDTVRREYLTCLKNAASGRQQETNTKRVDAGNLVIMDWFIKGDTRPLSDWLRRGHVPGQEVMTALAVMLVRGHPDADQRWFDDPAVKEIAEIFKLRPEVTGKGKRGGDPALHVRKKRIALEVAKAKRSMTEKEAFVHVSDWASCIGPRGMSADNVEKIYKEYKNLIRRTNSR